MTDLIETSKIKLNTIEKKIIECRVSDKSFCQLSDLEERVATDKIIIEGAAITGCALPQTESFAAAISNQLIKFINEFGYGELTLSEIMLAFLINSKGNYKFPTGTEIDRVKFIGNCINVDFVAEILSNYMSIRNSLDRKFQNEIDGY